jgi:multidrug efflux system membrane fusion protein
MTHSHSVPRRGRRTLAPLAILVLAAGCVQTSAQPGPPPPPQVTVASVIERDVTEWDEFTGRLQAVDSVEVRPRVSGLIAAVRFQEGAIVRRGDPLFEIDPRPFQAEVDRLRAELNRAGATNQRAASELQTAEKLRAENAIANLEFTRVTSPIDGRVGRAIVTEGNLVSSGPGEATLLTTVVSLDPVYAYFDADEQIFLKYSAAAGPKGPALRGGLHNRGAELPIRMALANDESFPRLGRLDFIDNQLDGATGTIRGRAIFRNGDGQLTPGLFVRLRLAGTGSYRGLLIQDRAVGTDLSKKFVYVVGPKNEVQYRTVTLGPIVDGLRVVRTGLEAGESVVVNGLQRVRPGVQVTPVVEATDHSS